MGYQSMSEDQGQIVEVEYSPAGADGVICRVRDRSEPCAEWTYTLYPWEECGCDDECGCHPYEPQNGSVGADESVPGRRLTEAEADRLMYR